MKNAEAILAVKFSSTIHPEKLVRICLEDIELFRNVPGLIQKYYINEESTGDLSGFYIFENVQAREAFWNSELAKKIPARYGVKADTLRVERYEMVLVMNDQIAA